MARPFEELRIAILRSDVTQIELAKRIGIARSSFTAKMTARSTFTLYEAYRLCQELEIPPERFTDCFPIKDVLIKE
jgi:transcriptional regulator with XRE-family HTH domain